GLRGAARYLPHYRGDESRDRHYQPRTLHGTLPPWGTKPLNHRGHKGHEGKSGFKMIACDVSVPRLASHSSLFNPQSSIPFVSFVSSVVKRVSRRAGRGRS